MAESEADLVRRRLQASLRDALSRRDAAAAAALRSVLSAIDNDESVSPPQDGRPKLGVGAAEVTRRHLSRDDLTAILGREVEERISAAKTYERAGRHEQAARLRAEVAVIERHMAG